MGRPWGTLVMLGLMTIAVASCGGQKAPTPASGTSSSTSSGSQPTTTPTSAPITTTTVTESLSVSVVTSPNPASVGVPVTFTVVIRGPGVLSGEDVGFGDGGTSGANAGEIECGQTTRVDTTRTYTHSYTAPGAYQFRDAVSAQAPPPSCTPEDATGTATVVVSSPLHSVTTNGAFVSPTGNIACVMDVTSTNFVRCVTFSPPQLVTMTSTGVLSICTGSQCELGNPARETPKLAYGTATGAGPFQCLSATNGITCTLTNGRGFTIARSGIKQIGG
jgi:hypothetical protein